MPHNGSHNPYNPDSYFLVLYDPVGRRFYEAREALIKELPANLFEPPYPISSGSPARETIAGSISPRSDDDIQDT